MKNNISYYPHKTESHNHWKFKTLRKKFGWAGEGRFWALHNIICDSENCCLDIEEEEKFLSIAADIELSEEEFNQFLDFLVIKCKLLFISIAGKITSETAQETLNAVNGKRKYQREWSKKSSIEKGNSSIESTLSNIETKDSTIDFRQSKVNKSKVNDVVESPPPIEGFLSLETLKIKVLQDSFYLSLITQKGIDVKKVELWLDAFNRFLKFKNKLLKQEGDYRSHFPNWLVKIPNYRTANPEDYDPSGKDPEALKPQMSKEANLFKTIMAGKK